MSLVVLVVVALWLMPWMMRVLMRHKIARMTREGVRKARSTQRRGRSRKRLMFIWACAGLPLIGAAALGLLAHSWVPFIGIVALIANYTGMGLIVWGWRSRVGKRIVCAKCDYAMGSWRAASERCPECRNAWKEPWRARLGERRVRVRVIAMGALMLVMNAAGVMVLMSIALRR